jgi:hypothetical protein
VEGLLLGQLNLEVGEKVVGCGIVGSGCNQIVEQ